MKTLYITLVGFLLCTGTEATSQTKIIAHKSHSGSAATFDVGGSGNFGLNDDLKRHMYRKGRLEKGVAKVIRLSDTSAIEVSIPVGFRFLRDHQDSGSSAVELNNVMLDTVYHNEYWNNPAIGIDSLQQLFPNIEFEGYEKSESKAPDGFQDRERLHSLARPGGSEYDSRGLFTLTLISSVVGLLLGGGIWSSSTRHMRS